MGIVYRQARLDDLKPAADVVREALTGLEIRHGFEGPSGGVDTSFPEFSLAADPSGLWVAEDDGRIVGFGFSWQCGDLWFLADLFVHPDWQSRGIGRALMNKTLAQAVASDAKIRALITFAYNRGSLGLYISQGLYPRVPLYEVSLSRGKLDSFDPKSVLDHRVLVENSDSLILEQIDQLALGISRALHHQYSAGDATLTGLLLTEKNGRPAGYVYISKDGHIGPLAVTSTGLMGAAFHTAICLARDQGANRISAFIPGVSDDLMGISAGLGMKLGRTMVLLSSRAFGDWTRYSPRHPGYM